MFTLNNKNYLCKSPVVKESEDMSAGSLILASKVIFSEFGLPKKIMSDVGGNFISDKLKQSCKNMNMEQATSSLHHYNGQVDAFIKFIKHTIKMYQN